MAGAVHTCTGITKMYILFQLMSTFYILLIGSNIINHTLTTILVIFSLKLPLNIALVQIFCESMLWHFFLLTLIEISWLKYLHKFVWKSIRPLDEGFVVAYCTLNNTVFSALLSIAWIKSSGGKFLLMTITNPMEWHMNYWINDGILIDNNYFR